MLGDLAVRLLREYKATYERDGHPDWASNFPPTIPFIGRDWVPGEGVLVYASAENLAGTDWDPDGTPLATNPWDRHRADFEEWKVRSTRSFFPSLHIQPASDGPLQVAAAFIRGRAGLHCPRDPAQAVELGCFANLAKFAIKSDAQNRDYANDFGKLTSSLPYLRADLEVLNPRLVLLPRTMFSTLRGGVGKSAATRAQWVDLVDALGRRALLSKQANQRALNHLRRVPEVMERADLLEQRLLTEGAPWLTWLPRVRGVNEQSLWRLMAEIDLNE